MTPDDELEVTRLTITRTLSDEGDVTHLEVTPDDVPLVEALGLLRLAEDTIIRERMGETP